MSARVQREVVLPVGELDRPLGLHERLGVAAGEEAQLSLDGRQLGTSTVITAALRERLRLGRQRDGAAQVTALEHDRGLQHQRAAAQRSVLEHPRDLVAPDRLGQRTVVVLVMDAAGAIQRTVNLDRITRGHTSPARPPARGTAPGSSSTAPPR